MHRSFFSEVKVMMGSFVLMALTLGSFALVRADSAPPKDDSNATQSAATPATQDWGKIQADFGVLQASSPDDPASKGLVASLVAETHDFAEKYPADPHAPNAAMLWAQLGDMMTARQWTGGPSEEEITQAFDKLAVDPSVPKDRRAEIRAMELSRAMQQAAQGGTDSAAQWAAMEDGFARFKKEFGADFSFDQTTPALSMLRDEQISILASSPDSARYEALLQKLAAYPDPQVATLAQQQIEAQKQLAILRTKPLDLKYTSVNGTPVDVAKLRGKVVLIDFWATWCGPCVGEVPDVVAAYNKYHGQGFDVVGVSLDQDKDKLQSFTKEHGMTWPQYFDGQGWDNKISKSFGIQAIPAMWLVDKQGMLVTTNASDGLADRVEKLLKAP
jgi:thiol-disulfide isomerase/thioredoxin